MRTVIGLLLTLISLATYAGEGPFARKMKKLRVMTYNIHHCNPPSAGAKIEVEAIARVITNEKPDFVALQEVDVNTERSGKGLHQAKELARLTGMHYFFSKAIDHQGGDYGVAVLSRFPIIDSTRLILPIDPVIGGETRTIAAITVEVAKGKKVIFASTHLDLKEPNRLSQSELIINLFKDSTLPVILAGDFNAQPDSKVIGLLDQNFTRSCLDCKPTIPVKEPNRVIDFIMFKPGSTFKSLSTRVIDEQYASDHLPVVAELGITY
ncbi:endonuclease/exonuclease/phosphatase family protein [Spirosoma foliorum]|uniref:Endonuclease/exonuclease/phosphatase family protein n=1 Tax=Spirosoma foliorum TaxID=2710596 RepID=A0A7G5GPS4_9BACT|nr:endonuclease/exonuclease/phosphatase family protein [Spirosoma foliorum]QMW00866.1 endonuclease/exonuclease/phosphatase family protein [Spirosoma foliorum]